MTKTYLGDGAYAEWDGLALVLTTENGIEVGNRVVLEPAHIVELLRFLQAQQIAAEYGTNLLTLLMAHVDARR